MGNDDEQDDVEQTGRSRGIVRPRTIDAELQPTISGGPRGGAHGFPARPCTETTLREGNVRGLRTLGTGTQAETQVRGRQSAPDFPFDTYVGEGAEAEATTSGEPTLRGGQTRVEASEFIGEVTQVPSASPLLVPQSPEAGGTGEVTAVAAGVPEVIDARQRRHEAQQAAARDEGETLPSVRPGTDEIARGFPLPAPASEVAEDEHTEVQAGPMGVRFIPEDHGLGPGFASVSQMTLPLAMGARQNPLPGIAPMMTPVPRPAPIIKSVSVPVPTAWDELASQPVGSERHLTPQRVALTRNLTSLTSLLRLSRAQRWIALTVLLFAGGLLLMLRGGDEKMPRASSGALLAGDAPVSAEQEMAIANDAQTTPVASDARAVEAQVADDPEREAVPAPETPPEPVPDAAVASLDAAPRRDAAKARSLRNRGRQLFKRGKHAAALRMYQKAFAANPIDPEIQRDLAKLHHRRGEWPQAREAYRDYLKLAPRARDARQIRAILYRLRKR